MSHLLTATCQYVSILSGKKILHSFIPYMHLHSWNCFWQQHPYVHVYVVRLPGIHIMNYLKNSMLQLPRHNLGLKLHLTNCNYLWLDLKKRVFLMQLYGTHHSQCCSYSWYMCAWLASVITCECYLFYCFLRVCSWVMYLWIIFLFIFKCAHKFSYSVEYRTIGYFQ